MLRALLIGLIGIFVILSFQFRSFIEPLTVMVAIPLALIGVVWGHVFMGIPLSLPSMLGFASLAGIVVNDSILLVEFIKHRRRAGSTTPEAAQAASRDRFRAVLLTSLTTILGLLPLLTETSLQAQILIPLVTSVIFGLTGLDAARPVRDPQPLHDLRRPRHRHAGGNPGGRLARDLQHLLARRTDADAADGAAHVEGGRSG